MICDSCDSGVYQRHLGDDPLPHHYRHRRLRSINAAFDPRYVGMPKERCVGNNKV